MDREVAAFLGLNDSQASGPSNGTAEELIVCWRREVLAPDILKFETGLVEHVLTQLQSQQVGTVYSTQNSCCQSFPAP
jgi:hypothetical protein